MSLDGAVKVKTTEEETPSPPKQRPMPPTLSTRRADGLQRSRSEVDLGQKSDEGRSPLPRPFSGTFGRSRDARTWEFYCDSDARDALATQAEFERNGSAIGAISLIRSQSKKSMENLRAQQRRDALQPKSSALNVQKTSSIALGQKPKLSRAKSSMGRLQHDENSSKVAMIDDPSSIQSKPSRPSHIRSSSSDSDKENWAPGTRATQNPLRRTQPSAPFKASSFRAILQDNNQVPSHSTGLVGASGSDRKRARTIKRGIHIDSDAAADQENKENCNNSKFYQIDHEVAAFMKNNNTNRSGSSTEKEDDLDCIQGLLSLSQGAWR